MAYSHLHLAQLKLVIANYVASHKAHSMTRNIISQPQNVSIKLPRDSRMSFL